MRFTSLAGNKTSPSVRVCLAAVVAVGLMSCDVEYVSYSGSRGSCSQTVVGFGAEPPVCPGKLGSDRLSIENENYAWCGKPVCLADSERSKA